jgi:hypothetical protein
MQVAFEMDFHAMDLNDIDLCTVQGLCPVTKSPDSLANGLRARNAPIICQEKSVSHCGQFAAHFKHARAFQKANKLFKILIVTVAA